MDKSDSQADSQPDSRGFLQQLARFILTHCDDLSADLSKVHIFLPNALASHQLRLHLSQQAGAALIGPYIGSMQQWLNQTMALPDASKKIIKQPGRQLILLDALHQHSDLFRAENSWQVCDSLLDLFDELNLADIEPISDSEQIWRQHLQQAYGLLDASNTIPQLDREARIVHSLWQAWQQQTDSMGLVDESRAYRLRLAAETRDMAEASRFFVIGPEQLSLTERQWLQRLSNQFQVHTVVQSRPPEFDLDLDDIQVIEQSSAQSNFVTAAFQIEQPLLQRANAYPHSVMKPLQPRLFAARNAEQEALAVELQIRIWLLDGVDNIGIVTEDRKLARRVRALLERSGVYIQDTAGWSLATTSSATIVERWLECIEQDFAYQPMLDLLKSPFFSDPAARDLHLERVYRLEQDVILHENIAGDIQRYLRALHDRARRMQAHWPETSYQSLRDLLEQLSKTAQPLLTLYRNNRACFPGDYLNALIDGLKVLGIYRNLESDKAGSRIIQVLMTMQQGLSHAHPEMDWHDFRAWLASSIEQESFTPQDLSATVQLMNIKQAQYCQFEGLIIAAANKVSLPGSPRQSPFFNQTVRQALGLSTWTEAQAYALYQFKCLLQAAPRVLVSYKAEQDGEWLQPSPWVSSLEDFAQLALGMSLYDITLEQLLSCNLTLTECDMHGDADEQMQPVPVIQAELIPTTVSASRHQRLIDCPYKFFASDGLGLKAREDITEELQKAEYGEKVHLILQAFHQQVDNMPEPFKKPLNEEHRQQAISHMETLSRTVFQKDLEDTVQHRGWLQRWLKTIPYYIDWQIQQQQVSNIYQLEQRKSRSLSPGLELNGRLDRIDKQDNRYTLIDYKTGQTGSAKDIKQGEDVQLLSYAALLDEVDKVIYLSLDNGKVRVAANIEVPQLVDLSEQAQQRLIDLFEQMHNGVALPAWGDESACRYCDMSGLCRKQAWEIDG